MEERLVLVILDVGDKGLFASVQPRKVGALTGGDAVVEASEVPVGTLDLDYPCAAIGQTTRGHGSGHCLLE